MVELPRTRPLIGAYLVPAFAAAIWAGILVSVRDQDLATQRSLIFLGGPLLMLAGLHARLFPFLHAPARWRWLSLPLPERTHWRAATRGHAPAVVYSVALGALAVYASSSSATMACGLGRDLSLLVEFLWFGGIALVLEPLASAAAAALGRRFEPQSPASELQRSLGGGWTTPEAVIHLYAPAFCVGAAVLLAMPGQLGWERWSDGLPLTRNHGLAALAPVAIALALRAAARSIYARGIWEAIPWLREATRTLSGPPQPEATPAWARALPPHLRLLAIEFWRSTPLPTLRLILVLGSAVALVSRTGDEIGGPLLALAASAIAAWLVPAGALWRSRVQRRALCQALPLSQAQRAGGVEPRALTLLGAPPLLVLVALGVAALW